MAVPDPTLALFRALYPELAPIPDPTVLAALDINIELVNRSSWGRCWSKAVLLLTAHEVSSAWNRQQEAGSGGVIGNPGILQSGHEEGIAFAFQRPTYANSLDWWLGTTPYGQELMALARACQSRARLSW